MKVVERFVGNNTGRHVDDVAFRNGLGLAVGIEWLAEQTDSGRRGRGGERHKHLVGVVLADDFSDFLLLVLLGGFGVRLVRLAERQPNGSSHLAFLRPARPLTRSEEDTSG